MNDSEPAAGSTGCAVEDVLAYKADHFAKRSKSLDQLVAYDQQLGLE